MSERFVFIHLPGESDAVPAGRLTLFEEGRELRTSRFAYGQRYVQRRNAQALDPVSLPLGVAGELAPVNQLALFGAFRDATPDYWGRRVIESRLRAPADSLPESTYLDLAGPNRSGALDFRTALDDASKPGVLPPVVELEHLVDAAARIEEGEDVPAHLDVFFDGAPSVGGARPKAVVELEGRQWIAKFPSKHDRFDVPIVEYASLRLAREAGLNVPELRVRRLADGRNVMLIERFDRVTRDDRTCRKHMVSALTMLGLHESESATASYAQVAHAISLHGAGGGIAQDRAELFARMVFNVLVTNDDDHLRNHAFLHEAGGWRLSPLYDVVPKPLLGSERSLHLSVGPQGRAARLDNALSGAGAFGLLPRAAAQIIGRVVAVTRSWREHFEAFGVPPGECDRIARAFPRAADIGMCEVEKHLRN